MVAEWVCFFCGIVYNSEELYLSIQRDTLYVCLSGAPRFDSDLSAAKEEVSSETMDKEKIAREKETLHSDISDLHRKIKVRKGVLLL